MNREELIEKAARAMWRSNRPSSLNEDQWEATWDTSVPAYTALARAALSVFEQAHTPTDDERESLAAMIGYELYAERMSKAVGGRPSRSVFDTLGEVWRESWLETTRPIADTILAAGFRRIVQGEGEWEYGWAGDKHATVFYDTREEAEEFMGEPKKFSRRKAGEWEEV